jgi:hypothetical protein
MTQWGLDTLFNPAKRHMDEEKQRLQSTREEAGDSSGGKRIDLESGKVTIQRRRRPGQDAEDESDDPAEEPEAPLAGRAENESAEREEDEQAPRAGRAEDEAVADAGDADRRPDA